jgi:hypothetical protein
MYHGFAVSLRKGMRPAIWDIASASFSGWKVKVIPLAERQDLSTEWKSGVEGK